MAQVDIVLVPGRVQDAEQIAVLSRDTIEVGLSWSWRPRRVAAAIRNDTNLTVVAREAGGESPLVGFAIAHYGLSRAHLLLLAVSPRARRTGLGRSLVQWHHVCARVAGCRSVRVELRANNVSARSFYKTLGYEQVAVRPGYYEGRESAIQMVWTIMSPTP